MVTLAFTTALPIQLSRVNSLSSRKTRPLTKRQKCPGRILTRATAANEDGTEGAVKEKDTEAPKYSQRARFREEIEAPFRKVRMFVYGGSAASAGVGLFISSTRIIASLTGVDGVQPLSETIPNVGINLLVITICALLLRYENKSGTKRLERISRGAKLAALRIVNPEERIVKLSSLRRNNRVVIIAGKPAIVLKTLDQAYEAREQLRELSLQVVPIFTGVDSVEESKIELPENDGNFLLASYDKKSWKEWLDIEQNVARKTFGDKIDECLVVFVRLDGLVGARMAGTPDFGRIVESVKSLPDKDMYGVP